MSGGGFIGSWRMPKVKSELYAPPSRNVSAAWAHSLLRVMEPGVNSIQPLMAVIEDLDDGVPVEIQAIRQAVDTELGNRGEWSTNSVANTIFPESLWRSNCKDDAQDLFDRYERCWPKIGRYRENRRGTYFRRLTAYSRGKTGALPRNQLQHIIRTYRRGNHRPTALQATIFDPMLDHSDSRRQGFPCLHQVSFVCSSDGSLEVVAYYPMQYLFEKAYGNYMGLCRLGRFMGKQMGLNFIRLRCFAAVAKLGNPNKSDMRELCRSLKDILADIK